MSIYLIKGDITKSNCKYICHQVNCRCRMGSGVARSIRAKWPIVYNEYIRIAEEEDIGFGDKQLTQKYMLGHIQLVKVNNEQFVINMFAQDNYGYDGKQYTSYKAFQSCLNEILLNCESGASIAFPFKIGSDRGGADWDTIFQMIINTLGSEMEIFIYEI